MDKYEIQSIIKTIESCIYYHDKMRYAYFFSSPSTSKGRRYYEMQNSIEKSFTYKDNTYTYWSKCYCSSQHVYFSDGFTVDGQRKDVRAFKRVLKELKEKTDNND
ncbi:MAG TPA: hypothetical protein DCY31_06550 [Ruminococcaceae bacterium]|nr:hypothetical protein [Oscillospiraceae bacterium]